MTRDLTITRDLRRGHRLRAHGLRSRLAPSALALALIGCASGPEPRPECPPPPPGELVLLASPRLNPDASGAALPTEVRIYQLRDTAALETASFEAMWQDAAGTLGDALVSEETLTVFPRQDVHRAFVPDPEARSVVAMAIVREPAGRTWRSIVPIAPAARSDAECPAAPPPITFRLDAYRVEAVLPAREGS